MDERCLQGKEEEEEARENRRPVMTAKIKMKLKTLFDVESQTCVREVKSCFSANCSLEALADSERQRERERYLFSTASLSSSSLFERLLLPPDDVRLS